MIKITRLRVRHIMVARIAATMGRVPMLRARLLQHFTANLQYLNDTLQKTDLQGHYWIWGGLLLGWAREGAVLAHDYLDADFAVADEDFDRLVSAVPSLVKAGFQCDRRFVNSDGQITELTFARHGTRFDFFRLFPVGDRLHYYLYDITWKEIVEIEASIPAQDTVRFSFLDRSWLKHEDHALELRSVYGSWEVPDPSWSYLESLSIHARRISPYSHFDWQDGVAGLTSGSHDHSLFGGSK